MTVSAPYSWLKQIPRSLLQREGSPPFGYPPPFPWDEFAAALGQALQEKNTTLVPGAWQKLDVGSLLKGFGSDPALFTIDLSPLPGMLWMVVSQSELDRFMSWALTKQENPSYVLDPAYKSGFYQFLALQFFNLFRKSSYGKELTPHLLPAAPLPDEALYAQDFSFQLGETPPFGARVIFSEALRHAWKEKFAERTVSSSISIALAEKLSLTLHLEAGSTTLTTAEWREIQAGDFLLLYQCSIDPSKEKGRVMLTLNGRPLYRARIKEGKLKILEFPLYHEVESTMATQDADEEFEGLEEFTGEIEEESLAKQRQEAADSGEIADEEHVSPPHSEEGGHASESTLVHDADATLEEVPPDAASSAVATPPVEEEPHMTDGKVNVGNLPLTIVVEVGRLQISVRKLLEMQPGDLLDLDIDPDAAVDLVVGGTVVAKGELLKIGEMLGVRILDKV